MFLKISSTGPTYILSQVLSVINETHLIKSYFFLLYQYLTHVQSNSVITNSMGSSVFVRYNRDIVLTVKDYVVKEQNWAKNSITFCSL